MLSPRLLFCGFHSGPEYQSRCPFVNVVRGGGVRTLSLKHGHLGRCGGCERASCGGLGVVGVRGPFEFADVAVEHNEVLGEERFDTADAGFDLAIRWRIPGSVEVDRLSDLLTNTLIAMKGEIGELKGAVGTLQNQSPTP